MLASAAALSGWMPSAASNTVWQSLPRQNHPFLDAFQKGCARTSFLMNRKDGIRERPYRYCLYCLEVHMIFLLDVGVQRCGFLL